MSSIHCAKTSWAQRIWIDIIHILDWINTLQVETVLYHRAFLGFAYCCLTSFRGLLCLFIQFIVWWILFWLARLIIATRILFSTVWTYIHNLIWTLTVAIHDSRSKSWSTNSGARLQTLITRRYRRMIQVWTILVLGWPLISRTPYAPQRGIQFDFINIVRK